MRPTSYFIGTDGSEGIGVTQAKLEPSLSASVEQNVTQRAKQKKDPPTFILMFCWILPFGYVIVSLLRFVCARNSLEMSLHILSDGRCIATSRTVQMHKGLTNSIRIVAEDIGLFEDDYSPGMTRHVRLYAEEEETLWLEARRLCSAFEGIEQHSGDTMTPKNYVKDQFVLASTPQTPLISPPPMTLTPLLVSGPSENRVDLVFFGDGCKCLFLFEIYPFS